jgi:hypothetical protein
MMIVEGVINFSLSSCPTRARTGTHVSLAHLLLGQAKPPRRQAFPVGRRRFVGQPLVFGLAAHTESQMDRHPPTYLRVSR